MAAIAQAAGPSTALLLDHWAADLAALVDAVAACSRAALQLETQVSEACTAVDSWAEDTGMKPCLTKIYLHCNQAMTVILGTIRYRQHHVGINR